jgi:hypothetical protein
MNEPWFEESMAGWFGALVGVWGGLAGTLSGVLASRGKAKRLVLGVMWGGVALGGACFVAGISAWVLGQPYAVWYGLGLPGLIGTIVFLSLVPVVRNVYAQAELRRLQAMDI